MPHAPRSSLWMGLLAVVLAACTATSGGPIASADTTPSVPSVDPSEAATVQDAATLTQYDATAPLEVEEVGEPVTDDAGIAVHDVRWASPAGGRVSAWLVVPPGDGPFAGLVYLHGSITSRFDFLDEAIAMAHGGVVSLVIDAPFARTGDDRRYHLSSWEEPVLERGMTAQAIVDVRRAYDVLTARDDVDAERLGFVGHSWGASLGVALAAVDPRPGSLVLITGRPSWTGFLRSTDASSIARVRDRLTDAQWQSYLDLMAPLDATAEIGNVDAARLYLQYGTADDVVPLDVAQELIDAAPGARTDLYDAGHALDDEATADRVAWLVERWELDPIGADVLATVGLPDQ